MTQERFRLLAILTALSMVSAVLGAGANTWTGGRPVATLEGASTIVAADRNNPDVVYAAFGDRLHRSADGGRTWIPLTAFGEITALLVHPASPSTIYVGSAYGGVYKSADAGDTWSWTLGDYVYSLAGSPTDASTVFAGGWFGIHKTTDGGATWSSADLAGAISSLVIDPRDERIAYAGAEGLDTYFAPYPGGSFGKTTDGGASWSPSSLGTTESIFAVGVDFVGAGNVYVATGPYYSGSQDTPEVHKSEDGGISWTSASRGLPDVNVKCLVTDPRASGTVYAGTETGIYRTRDGGRNWTAFGQGLAHVQITSLDLDPTGRRLHAGTTNGAYELEMARGSMDVAAGAAGASHLLMWDGERLSIDTVDAAGGWSSGPPGGATATWTAVALTESGGGRTHVLWQNGDGRSALEIVGPSGRLSVSVFEKRPGWIASDLSSRADGQTDVLWTGADGRMSIASVAPDGTATDGPAYGPAAGWSAVAIADGSGGDTWVLWRSTDGRFALSVHRDGAMVASYKFAAHSDWAAEDLAVATDGLPRLLRTSPGGLASVATIDAEGRLTADQRYSVPGFSPRRIAAGADGQTRLLFGSDDGQGELLLLAPDNTESARHALR